MDFIRTEILVGGDRGANRECMTMDGRDKNVRGGRYVDRDGQGYTIQISCLLSKRNRGLSRQFPRTGSRRAHIGRVVYADK